MKRYALRPSICPWCYKKVKNSFCCGCGRNFSGINVKLDRSIKRKKINSDLPTYAEQIKAPNYERKSIDPHGRYFGSIWNKKRPG